MNKNKNNTDVILLSDPTERLIHPFNNKQLVFTGALSTMTRSEAAKKCGPVEGLCRGLLQRRPIFLF